jgi:hypothetical protein
MMKKCLSLLMFVVLMFLFQHDVLAENHQVRAAFIRKNDVWLKMNEKEYRLSYTGDTSTPLWSHDGSYLSFYRKDNMYIRDMSSKRHNERIAEHVQSAQWSPTSRQLAYISGGLLFIYDVEKGRSFPVTAGADQFSWFPDGKRLLVANDAKIKPDGWGQVELFVVPVDAHLNFAESQSFFVLPKQSDDFFAVTTSEFKWSPNQKWISFIAVPTASWSADSNPLCLLSSDGKKFQQLGKMLNKEEWMNWAPKEAKIGFIDGEGRFATQNKKLTIKELAAMTTNGSVTPNGYVDWDFTWHNNEVITVSRDKEAEWSNDETKRPLPSLYQLSLKTGEQKRRTAPPKTAGDFHPVYLPSSNRLTWIRSDRKKAFVWMGSSNGRYKKIWIRNLDVPVPYYDQYNWNQVISFYEK